MPENRSSVRAIQYLFPWLRETLGLTICYGARFHLLGNTSFDLSILSFLMMFLLQVF